MENKHNFAILLLLIILYSNLALVANAQSNAQISIASQGTIAVLVPTPMPPTIPTGNNLCAINDGKWYTDNPWGTSCPSSTYGAFYDYSTTHNGAPTWRLDPISSNWGIDHLPIPVNVGDHIVMSCWIKTGGSTPVPANGARIGMDWYTTDGGWHRIGAANNYYEAKTGLLAHSHDLDADTFVNWGSDWTYLEWDFYIQDEYASDGWYYPTNTMVQATHMFPWIGVVSQSGYPNGAYTCWFSDFQFYINP